MSRLSRLMNVLRGEKVDHDLDDELQYHLEARTADLIAAGMAPEEAAREARRRFGNVLHVRESVRDTVLITWLDSVLRDARVGLRLLGKHRVATAAAVLSLALTIGASTTAFSLIDALALRPLPVDEPEKLFHLAYDGPGNDNFSYPLFERLRQTARANCRLFGVAYGGPQQMAAFDGSGGREEQVRLQWISGDGLAIVGVQPALGRLLTTADDHPEGETWAVLSYAFWMRRFGGNPDVVGRPFTVALREMHGGRFRIAGVAQKEFHGLEPGEPVDMWLPLTTRLPARFVRRADFVWFHVRGRLLPDVSLAQAGEMLQPAFAVFRHDPGIVPPGATPAARAAYIDARLWLRPAVDAPSYMRSQFERPLWIVTGIALLVLLIACVNVACLFAARAEARRREMSLRVSIGAGRARLVQQMLIESGLVACAASVLGLGFALAAAPLVVPRLKTSDFPAYLDLRPDWRVLGFVLLAAVLTTLVAGLVPALRASTVSARRRFPRTVVAVQVAFSFAALFLAGLLLVSFRNLIGVDPGYSRDDVLECSVYPRETAGLQGPATARQLLETVRRMPDVRAASLSTSGLIDAPLGRSGTVGTSVRGREMRFMRLQPLGVGPGFFETMQIPVLAGHEFSDAEFTAGSAGRAIVSEAFARSVFPGESAVGKRFEMAGRTDMLPYEIVGVVGNARYHDLRAGGMPAVYTPFLSVNRATLQVRVAGDAAARTASLRDEIEHANPAIRLTSAAMQSARIADALRRDRLLALVAGFMAAVALMLAAVGLYGTLSYSVARRTREIGIRLALGAPHGSVVRLVMKDILLMTAIGVVVGLAAGFLLARPLGSILYQVRPSDLRSVALPLACLIAASGIAALPAAIRAVRVSPLVALKQE